MMRRTIVQITYHFTATIILNQDPNMSYTTGFGYGMDAKDM
jgi:hypothetical protein